MTLNCSEFKQNYRAHNFLKENSDHYIKLVLMLLFSELNEGVKLTFLYKNYYILTAQWLGYYVDGWRIWVQFQAGARDFLPTEVSKPDLGSNQPPVLWISGGLSPGLKQPRHDSDHTLASSTKVMNVSTIVLKYYSPLHYFLWMSLFFFIHVHLITQWNNNFYRMSKFIIFEVTAEDELI
jgi:hypothetical protein